MYRTEDVKVRNPRAASDEILALIEKVEAEGWEFVCFSPPMIGHIVPPPFVAVFRKAVTFNLSQSGVATLPNDGMPDPVFLAPGPRLSKEKKVATSAKRRPGRPKKNA